MTFALSIFAALCYWIIIALPGADFYDGQDSLVRTLGPVWQIVLASLLGFLAGQLSNAFTMVQLKKRSGEKMLFGRMAASTIVGEFVDTLVFCSIAAQVLEFPDFSSFLNYLFVGFTYKTAVELIFSPITMGVMNIVKRAEPEYGVEQ